MEQIGWITTPVTAEYSMSEWILDPVSSIFISVKGADRNDSDFKWCHIQKSTGFKSGVYGSHLILKRRLIIRPSPNISKEISLLRKQPGTGSWKKFTRFSCKKSTSRACNADITFLHKRLNDDSTFIVHVFQPDFGKRTTKNKRSITDSVKPHQTVTVGSKIIPAFAIVLAIFLWFH